MKHGLPALSLSTATLSSVAAGYEVSLPRSRFLQGGMMTLPIEASPECTQATNAFNEIPVFTQAWQAFEAAITAADPGDDCDLNLNVPVTMTCNFDFNQLVTDFNMVQTCHDNDGIFIDVNVYSECAQVAMGLPISVILDMKAINPACIAKVCQETEVEDFKAYLGNEARESLRAEGEDCVNSATFDFIVDDNVQTEIAAIEFRLSGVTCESLLTEDLNAVADGVLRIVSGRLNDTTLAVERVYTSCDDGLQRQLMRKLQDENVTLYVDFKAEAPKSSNINILEEVDTILEEEIEEVVTVIQESGGEAFKKLDLADVQIQVAVFPSSKPSQSPSFYPTLMPTVEETKSPSKLPSEMPSNLPSNFYEPSMKPSKSPSSVPSTTPSKSPSSAPSTLPSSSTPAPVVAVTPAPVDTPVSPITPTPPSDSATSITEMSLVVVTILVSALVVVF